MRANLLTSIIILAMWQSAWAGQTPKEANATRLNQIDRNKNGVLDPEDIDLGIFYRTRPTKTDLQFPPPAADVTAFVQKDGIAILLRHDFDLRHKGHVGLTYTFDEVNADEFKLPEPEHASTGAPSGRSAVLGRFFLRRSLDKILLSDDGSDKISKEMKSGPDKLVTDGALFSYGHAFVNGGSDEWLAQGVFGYDTPAPSSWFGAKDTATALMTLEFSRIDFGGTGKPSSASPRFKSEDNLANFGLTYQTYVGWPQVQGGFTGSSLALSLFWKTDWDFHSQIPMAQAEWTFLNGAWGMGSFNDKSSWLWWRFDPTVHADGGYVLQDGHWTKMHEGDTFAHIGPKLALTLIPFPNASVFKNNPLVLTVGIGEYLDLTEQSLEVRAFTADAAWYLRKPGSGSIGPIDPGVAITLAFRNYRNVENQTDDNSILLGLAVGF